MANMDLIVGSKHGRINQYSLNSGICLNTVKIEHALTCVTANNREDALLIGTKKGLVSCYKYSKRTVFIDWSHAVSFI